jgi:hypothetical protein
MLSLPKIIADFEVSLASAVSVGQTTATLSSNVDKDGNTIPNGLYCFTLDRSSSGKKEHIIATVTGTALSSIQSVNRQGTTSTGFARSHRLGANVIISDYAVLKRILDNVDGTTGFNSSVKLGYDADPSITSSDVNKFATVKFVNDTAIAGAPDATNLVKGVTKLSVAAVSASDPIAVGDNDGRVPTQSENDALQGTSGTPSDTNRYVTNDDTAEAATASRIPRRRSTGDITVPTTPTNSTDAASKAYVDGFTGIATENITANDAVSLNFYRANQTTFQAQASNKASVSTSGGTQTFAINCGTASTKGLVVFVCFGGASGSISDASVTYNGVSMTLRTSTALSSGRFMMFTLLNPANGSNNVVVTIPSNTLSSGDVATTAVCYNNVTSFDSPTSASAATLSITPSFGSVIISAASNAGFSATNSINNNTNVELITPLSFASLCRGDSGLSVVSTSSTVTFTAGNAIAAIVANNSDPILYGVSRSSASNPANGVNANLYTNFVGIASSTVTQGNSVSVISKALAPGFSSLTPLATYFLSNTPGAISTTAGTNTKRIGIATNTTTILLKDSI